MQGNGEKICCGFGGSPADVDGLLLRDPPLSELEESEPGRRVDGSGADAVGLGSGCGGVGVFGFEADSGGGVGVGASEAGSGCGDDVGGSEAGSGCGVGSEAVSDESSGSSSKEDNCLLISWRSSPSPELWSC